MLESRLSNLSDSGINPFTFAGFDFPKYVWTLPRGDFKKRIESHTPGKSCTGDYYHAPTPGATSMRFYLSSVSAPDLRWDWCDEVKGVDINHRGWFTDDFADGGKIRGVVFRLAKSRGFLIGWSMGENMASTIEYAIYDDAESAAYAADSLAENAAEEEREYQSRINENEESCLSK